MLRGLRHPGFSRPQQEDAGLQQQNGGGDRQDGQQQVLHSTPLLPEVAGPEVAGLSPDPRTRLGGTHQTAGLAQGWCTYGLVDLRGWWTYGVGALRGLEDLRGWCTYGVGGLRGLVDLGGWRTYGVGALRGLVHLRG